MKIKEEVILSKPSQLNQNFNKNGFLNKSSSNEIKNIYLNKQSSMCKIKYKKDGKLVIGTGFFCEINEDNIPFKKALFTNRHVLNKSFIKEGKEIIFECMDIKNRINFCKNRIIITCKTDYDYTCFEILDSDNITNNFFKIDKEILGDKNKLKNLEIFVLQYPGGGNLNISAGKILEIKNGIIYHDANTLNGSSGSPLIKRKNNNYSNFILGIHFGGLKNQYNLALPFDIIIKDIKDQIISFSIEIIDSYMCRINYEINKQKITDIGILIKIPIYNSNNNLFGILMRNHISDNILKDIKTINIFEKGNKIKEIDSKDIFIFSDPFLNVTFIEIKNTLYNFNPIYEGDITFENALLIKYPDSNESNSCYFQEIEILGLWGINICYKEKEKYINNYDYNISYSKLALILNKQIIGIYQNNIPLYDTAININIITKAINLSFKNNLKQIKKRKYLLNQIQIKELKEQNLEKSEIPNLFFSTPSKLITPIWFYRTKYAWYWTPKKPEKNEITKSNWMIIYPGNSLEVIGGKWNGIEPAPKNTIFIRSIFQNDIYHFFLTIEPLKQQLFFV